MTTNTRSHTYLIQSLPFKNHLNRGHVPNPQILRQTPRVRSEKITLDDEIQACEEVRNSSAHQTPRLPNRREGP